jgi:hypothetical protein
VPRRIGDALSPRESSVSRNVSFVPKADLPTPALRKPFRLPSDYSSLIVAARDAANLRAGSKNST